MKDNDRESSSRLAKLPGALKHAGDGKQDADLQRDALVHIDAHPGLRFAADVLGALHKQPDGLRTPTTFYTWFPPQQVLEAFKQRPDLRVRIIRALTGGPSTLLRRVSPAELAGQIDLLVAEDLPESERVVRAETDRSLSVRDIYLKYVDPADVATYLPAKHLWEYEAHDSWWTRDPSPATRALMVAQWRSVRQHKLLSDSEILDLVSEDVLETHLPVRMRVRMRVAARLAARDGRPFSDSDLFDLRSPDGARDFIEELAEHVPLPVMRKVVAFVAAGLGLTSGEGVMDARESTANGAAAGMSVANGAAAVSASKTGGAAKSNGAVTPAPVVAGPAASSDKGSGRGSGGGKSGGGWIPVGRRAAAEAATDGPTVVAPPPKFAPAPPITAARGGKTPPLDVSEDDPPLPDGDEFVTTFDDDPTKS